MKPWTNIAILDISPSKTVVGQGYTLHIYVSVQNQGWNTETFNVSVYANKTLIETKEATLTSGNSSTLTFTWNTTGYAYGNYIIKAYAWPIPGETDIGDNTYVNGQIIVTFWWMEADFNSDGDVDGWDLRIFCKCYSASP
jgi:hypothetical protein